MQLTHTQKNYIKKYIRQQGINEVSNILKIPQDEILDYLEKKWGKNKLNGFLHSKTHQIEKNVPKNPGGIKNLFKNHSTNLLILTVFVFITYAYFLNNAFISDDIAEIAQKSEIANFSRVLQFPTGPIRHFIYWVCVHLAGTTPWIFRLTNLIFHILSTNLLYIILFLIYRSKKAAFAGSSLFAIHPAIAEAVLWISGGMYAQYTFFFLFSFLFYILSEKKKLFYWASVLTYLFSLMSHPIMPIPLFIIYPLYDFCFRQKIKLGKALPYLILALIYAFLAIQATPARETDLQIVHYQEKGIDNPLLILPVAISSYAELLFFPRILTLYHSELSFGTISFILRSLLALSFLIAIPFSLFKKQKSIFFWLSFFIISLSPTLTPFRLNWIVAERYIYLSSIGIFTLIGVGFDKLSLLKKKYSLVLMTIFAILITILSIRTFMRGIDWESEDNLWIATGKTSPSSPNTHNNLGDVYGRQGDKQAALREFSRAIELKPNYADGYHNLGNTYRELGQFDKALESYAMAAKLNPHLWQSYQNMAALYFQQKQYDKALESLQKAISINPKNLNLINNLGIVYLAKGEKDKAKEVFSSVLAIDPQNQFANIGLAEAKK